MQTTNNEIVADEGAKVYAGSSPCQAPIQSDFTEVNNAAVPEAMVYAEISSRQAPTPREPPILGDDKTKFHVCVSKAFANAYSEKFGDGKHYHANIDSMHICISNLDLNMCEGLLSPDKGDFTFILSNGRLLFARKFLTSFGRLLVLKGGEYFSQEDFVPYWTSIYNRDVRVTVASPTVLRERLPWDISALVAERMGLRGPLKAFASQMMHFYLKQDANCSGYDAQQFYRPDTHPILTTALPIVESVLKSCLPMATHIIDIARRTRPEGFSDGEFGHFEPLNALFQSLLGQRQSYTRSRDEIAAFAYHLGRMFPALFPEGFDPDLYQAQSGLFSNLLGLDEGVEKLKDLLDVFVNEGDSLILKLYTAIISAVLVIYGVVNKHKICLALGSAFGIATATMMVRGPKVKDLIDFFSDPLSMFSAQSSSIIGGAVALIFSLVQHVCFGKEEVEFDWSFFSKVILNFPKVSKSFTSLFEWISELVKVLYDFFKFRILKIKTGLFCGADLELEALLDSVTAFNQEYISGNLTIEHSSATRLNKIKSELRAALRVQVPFAEQGRRRTLITEALHVLEQIEEPFKSAYMCGHSMRMRSLGIFLNGGSGSGKTTLVPAMSDHLVLRTVPIARLDEVKSHINDFKYLRFQESKFWDGYHQQWLTIFDDFGQQKDTATERDNEYMDIIRCCSTEQYSLHMANLSEKGRTFFHSEIVLATSNLKDFREVKSIRQIDALERRFDVTLTVAPKPEYCTPETAGSGIWERILDVSKIPEGNEFCTDIYEFHEFKFPRHGKNHTWDVIYTGRVLNYDQMLEEVEIKYNKRKEQFERYCAQLAERREEIIQKRKNSSAQGAVPSKEFHENGDFGPGFFPASAEVEDGPGEKEVSEEFLIELQDILVAQNYPYTAIEFMNLVGDLVDHNWSEDAYTYFHFAQEFVKPSDPYCVATFTNIVRGFKKKHKDFFDHVKGFKNKVFNKIQDLQAKYPFWNKVLKGLAVGGSIIGVLSLLWKSFKWIRSDESPVASVNIPTASDRNEVFTSEAGYDLNLQNIMTKILNRNQYAVYCGGHRAGFATFVKDRFAIMPWHFITGFRLHKEKCPTIELISSNKKIRYTVAIDDFDDKVVRMGQYDLAVVEFPRKMRCHPNILKFFIPNGKLSDRRDYMVQLVINDDDTVRKYCSPAQYVGNSNIRTESDIQMCSNTLSYYAKTNYGDCGALLCHDDRSIPLHKIIGFHIGGLSDGKALGTCVPGDLITEYISKFETVDYDLDELPIPEAQMDGPFVTLGKVSRGPRLPNKTRIKPGELYGHFVEPTTAPAHLTPGFVDGELVNPMTKGLLRYDGPVVYFNTQVVNAVRDTLYAHLVSSSKMDIPGEVLSFDEAVLGRPGEQYFDAIPRNTSSGYPYNVNIPPQYPGKTWFFGKEAEYDLNNAHCDQLRERCAKIIEDARSGKRNLHIFADYLKDERRPFEKVTNYKTRLIFASPIDYLIVSRMYFMSFARWMMINRVQNGVAVGINAYQEWDFLARFLLSHSDRFVAGDFSGFDGSEVADILWAVYDVIETWYKRRGATADETRVRFVLWQEVVNSIHISGKTIYEWSRSLPSGHPLTTIINSLYCQFLFRLCWYSHNGKRLTSVGEFDQKVRLVSYGDDSISSVCPTEPDFNQNTIPRYMSEYGAVWTHESKDISKHYEDFRSIDQIDFLKRGFRKDEDLGKWLAPLSLTSVLEPCIWTKDGPFELQTQCDNVNGALRELPLHGREVFDQYAPRLLELSERLLKHVPPYTDYQTCLEITLATESYY